MPKVDNIFSEIFTNLKELDRRLKNFETWEPVSGTNKGAHAYLTGNQVIGAAAWTTIVFDSEFWDTDSIHSAGIFTAPIDGRYLFNANIPHGLFAGTINLRFLPSYDANDVIQDNQNAGYQPITLTGIYQLSAGDTVEVQVYAIGGVTVLSSSTNHFYSFCQVELLAAT